MLYLFFFFFFVCLFFCFFFFFCCRELYVEEENELLRQYSSLEGVSQPWSGGGRGVGICAYLQF